MKEWKKEGEKDCKKVRGRRVCGGVAVEATIAVSRLVTGYSTGIVIWPPVHALAR